jgi:hypothetical protein
VPAAALSLCHQSLPSAAGDSASHAAAGVYERHTEHHTARSQGPTPQPVRSAAPPRPSRPPSQAALGSC